MSRFLFRTALVLLAVFLVAGVYVSDRILFERPERKTSNYAKKLADRIRDRHAVAFLMTFDEPELREWIGGSRVIASGVVAAPGRHGVGRRFSGTRWSMIHTPANWRHLTPEHTISIWIQLMPPSDQQDILFNYHQQRHVGLRLENGRMTYHIPKPAGIQSISYPFTRWNEFVQIVAVTDPDAGRARLYEDGVLMAEGPIDTVDFPSHNIEFGSRRWYATRDPLHAVVDETAIWNRALTEPEVLRLFHMPSPILATLDRSYYRKWRWTGRLERGIKRALNYIDLFNPRLHQGRIETAEIPEIHLMLRNRHIRHFNRAHHHSLQSGRRTDEAAEFKRVEFLYNGQAARGELALDGGDLRYGRSNRRAFILDTVDAPVDGMRSLRLVPPEDMDILLPLLDAEVGRRLQLPHTRNGLCRLKINGVFAGVYYYEDDTKRAVSPDAGLDYARGPSSTVDWPFLFRSIIPLGQAPRGPSRNGIPLSAETLNGIMDQVESDALPLLVHDAQSPISSREIRYRLRGQRALAATLWKPADTGSPAERIAAYLTPFMFLGDNPSPHYIRGDLNLHALSLPGARITWSSSDPRLIDAHGRVNRPTGDRPQGVTLTAEIVDGASSATRSIDFRVMPERPRIPAFMLYTHEGLQKNRRVDGRIEHYRGGIHEPEYHRVFGGSGSGVKYRGNSAYWQRIIRLPDFSRRKFGLSIRYDDPHHILNDTSTRHLYFSTGYTDPSLIKNKLSYDLFKAMSTENAPRHAPDVDWMELFINGHYRGVYEVSTRVDRHMLGFDRYHPDDPDPAVLYKFTGVDNNFARINMQGVVQKQPPRYFGLHFEPYRELTDLVGPATPEEFAENIEHGVDVDAVLDFSLLLNITENADGMNVNLYLARDRMPGSRFFILPWDYDKSFTPRPKHPWFSNALTSRLQREAPGFPARMLQRWTELRHGPWTEEALRARIDEMESHLDGYIQWDYHIWGHEYDDGVPFAQRVGTIRNRALQRLLFMDHYIARLAGATAGDTDVETVDTDDRERTAD